MTDEFPGDDMPEFCSDPDHLLAAEYALGLLTGPEADAFEELLLVDHVFRAHYLAWAAEFAALTDDIAIVAPPKSVWTGIESRLFPEDRQGFLRRIGLLPALAGGLIAALLVVAAANFDLLTPTPVAGPTLQAEVAAEDRSLIVLAAYDPEAGTLTIDRQAGGAAPGRALELWLIAGDAAPVSLGLLPEAATASMPMPASMRGAMRDGLLAISDEPAGGSPTGAPTGAVLAVGPITPVSL